MIDEDLIDEFDDVEEFDIQKTVLKQRTKKENKQLYVEYDRLSFSVTSISPIKITASNKRHLIETIDASELTEKVFQNKVPLSKVIIKKNHESGKLELQRARHIHKSEFDFISATTTEFSYFHISCDVVSKNIDIIFDYDIFKLHISQDRIIEKDLANFPEYIEIYCIDRNERSRLYDKLKIKTSALMQMHSIRHRALWLPNSDEELEKISFIYYNDNQIISTGKQVKNISNNLQYKPNILYSQEGNVLKLQSTMQDVMSFKLDKNIILYSYAKHDPAKMLGSIKLSSDQFNNYNYFEVKLSTSKEIKLMSDCFHLHLEEYNVNSY